jgi:glucokinase
VTGSTDDRRSAGWVAALDVGGTSIKAGLVGMHGVVLEERRVPTGTDDGPRAVVDGIVALAADLATHDGVVAVGIGVPGIVDADAGIARYASNLGWRDVPFGTLVGECTGLPVALGHDVRNAALAEATWGAAASARSMYFLAIGTGIAGGAVRDGVVDDGATGQAGEIGHMVVVPGGLACPCGNRGCLETVASASRIGAAYARATGTPRTAADVAADVRAGDPLAVQVWTTAVDVLADGLAALTVLTDPGLIVLGGGLSLAGPVLLDPLRPALAARLTFRDPPPLLLTELGDRAGLLGAGARAWRVVHRDTTSEENS